MVQIISIQPGSIAEELGITAGSYLISINKKTIHDRLDYRFYGAEEQIEMHIKQGDEETIFEIDKDHDEDIGLELEEMKLKACGNNCVFCFVYQNPKGMRKALYFKDEDFRFSFMYGHYVTMTRLTQKDLQRIIEQRLSPLYISVHATEGKTRQFLLGIKRDDHLLEKIEFLTAHGIELHAQIVLCPGVNDGAVFRRTVADLKNYFLGLKSIAVVPLGLTQFRGKLTPLRMHTEDELRSMIGEVDELRQELVRELGVAFVYLADEFFIKAGVELPPAEYYDDFYQIENGVGEFRDMIDRFKAVFSDFPKQMKQPVRLTWVTGSLAHKPLEEFIINPLRKIKNLNIDLIPVINKFYGAQIGVSGLLTAQDIYEQLSQRELGDIVLLPPRVLNQDSLFLDDWTVADLEAKLDVPCHVYTEPLDHLVAVISEKMQSWKKAIGSSLFPICAENSN